MASSVKDLEEGKSIITEVINKGSALKCFHDMIISQGVAQDTASILCYGDPRLVLPQARHLTQFTVKETGKYKYLYIIIQNMLYQKYKYNTHVFNTKPSTHLCYRASNSNSTCFVSISIIL